MAVDPSAGLERTIVTIELEVDHTAGLDRAVVAGYAELGARQALEGIGLPTPYPETDDAPRVRAHTAAIRVAGF